ncbi:MAG: hypothetical protein DMG17_33625 [Acidobacteria bacterium]|nr:MAG: hypothetical protein DMG17_33625 [Acidobacteriota bacterium]
MHRVVSSRSTFNNGRRVIREVSPATPSPGVSPVGIRIGIGFREVRIRRPMSSPTCGRRPISSKNCFGRFIFERRDAYRTPSRSVKKAGWQTRPPPRPHVRQAVLSGRGIAFGEHGPEKRATIVADVQVDGTSGRVHVSKIVIATACGRIINPRGLRHQVQGAVLQGVSRSLFEAVKFDRSHVTSLDWQSYPVLRFPDVPDIETVLLDQRDVEPSGAGELATVPVAAALCNAIFDATGVRLRQVPFTPDRVKSAVAAVYDRRYFVDSRKNRRS